MPGWRAGSGAGTATPCQAAADLLILLRRITCSQALVDHETVGQVGAGDTELGL